MRANDSMRALDLGCVSDRSRYKFDTERRRRGLGIANEVIVGGRPGIGHESSALEARCDLLEHGQPLACDTRIVKHQAGEIAARPRQAGNKT